MKSNLDTFFKTDDSLTRDGVWFNLSETVGFLIRPFLATNPRVKKVMDREYKPYARAIETGTLSEEKSREIGVKVFVDSCLTDWRGIEIDGKETPFSREVAVEFLMSLPELYVTLVKQAEDFKNYKVDFDPQAREELGNS